MENKKMFQATSQGYIWIIFKEPLKVFHPGTCKSAIGCAKAASARPKNAPGMSPLKKLFFFAIEPSILRGHMLHTQK